VKTWHIGEKILTRIVAAILRCYTWISGRSFVTPRRFSLILVRYLTCKWPMQIFISLQPLQSNYWLIMLNPDGDFFVVSMKKISYWHKTRMYMKISKIEDALNEWRNLYYRQVQHLARSFIQPNRWCICYIMCSSDEPNSFKLILHLF
jgi:hypothetical protein